MYQFEYLTDKKQDKVVINTNMNFTEVFAPDISVFNYFAQVGLGLPLIIEKINLICKSFRNV